MGRIADNITKRFSKEDNSTIDITGQENEVEKNIDLEDLRYAYKANPVGWRAINKRSTDPWDKFLEVRADDEVWDEAMDLMKRLDFQKKAQELTKFGLLYGSAALGMGFRERNGSEKDMSNKVGSVNDIEYLNVITRRQMADGDDAFDINEEDFGTEEYGEIQALEIEDEHKINKDRFIYFRPYSDRNSPEGVSLLRPMHTSLTVFDNVVYGAGQSYYFSGTGFPTLETNGLSDEKEKEVRNDFLTNIQDRPGMVYDQNDFNFSFKGAEGKALDPRKYLEPMFTILGGALGGSKQVFFGAESGEVSGSRTNLEEYFGDVSSFQKFALTPFVEEFIDRMMEFNILEEKEYEIVWNDMFEKSEEKKAEIAKNKARAFAQFKKSGLTNEEAAKLSGLNMDIIKDPEASGMADETGIEAGEPSPEERDEDDLEPEA